MKLRRPGRAAEAPVRKTGQKGSTPLGDFWLGVLCGIIFVVVLVVIGLYGHVT